MDSVAAMRRSFAANPELTWLLRAHHASISERTDAVSGRLALDDIAFSDDGFVPDFIKIDIEGDELAALKGATRLLSEHRPGLVIETHSAELEADCRELLEELSYNLTVVGTRAGGYATTDRRCTIAGSLPPTCLSGEHCPGHRFGRAGRLGVRSPLR